MGLAEIKPEAAVAAAVTVAAAPMGSGKWSSSCCDCCTDCCTCCAGMWCPCFPIVQLSARMKGEPGRFVKVLALMWVIIILYYGFCMYYFYGPEGYNEPPRVPT